MASAYISPLTFAQSPTNVTAGEAAVIEWSSNEHPANLTLCLSGSQGHSPVSVLISNFSGDYYSWVPSVFLPYGNYSLELSQQLPQQNEVRIFSNDVTFSRDEGNNGSSGSSKTMESGTAFVSSTGSTGTASFTQSPAADSTSISGNLASEHGSSFGPATATATVSGTTAALPASSLQPANVQPISVVHQPISNGTIAGIVVGAVLFLLFAIASATLCWRRRRRSSKTAVSELPAHPTDNDVKSDPAIWIPELDQEGAVYGPHELADTATPMAQSLRSLKETETQPAEGRVPEIADTECNIEV